MALRALLVGLCALAGCTASSQPPQPKADSTAPIPTFRVPYPVDGAGTVLPLPAPPTLPDQTADLRAAGCPNPLVVQASSAPSLDQLELFQLASEMGTVSTDRYVAPLLDPSTGQPTGVDIEIRNGGGEVRPTVANAVLNTDPQVFAAQVPTESAVTDAARYPSVAVIAPRERSPQMIFWDEATYPTAVAIPDLPRLGAKVRYEAQAAFMDYLTSVNVLASGDVDPTSDSTPAVFVADKGRMAQQGSAIVDPYVYADPAVWGRPIRLQLIADTGYDPYPAALAVRPETVREFAGCLRALVPLVQRAQTIAASAPEHALALIVGVNTSQGRSDTPASALLRAGVDLSLEHGVIANGEDSILGNIDGSKIDNMIAVLGRIATVRATALPEGLRADMLFTNAFIDRGIGLAAS